MQAFESSPSKPRANLGSPRLDLHFEPGESPPQFANILKLVFIIKDIRNSCKIYILIKLYNKRNYYINKYKTIILILISINIYKLLLVLKLKYKYFFKIVNNYFCKI